MKNDFPGGDVKAIWQNQTRENSTMTMKLIQYKARDLRAKTRRELYVSVAAVVISAGLSGAAIVLTRNIGLRLACAFTIAWVLAGQYFLHRGMWSATLPGDAGLTSGLEFYRGEVRRRSYIFGRALRWMLGPVVLSLVTFIVALYGILRVRGSFKPMMPFCTLVVLWGIGVIIQRARARRELLRELDELSDIEKEVGRG